MQCAEIHFQQHRNDHHPNQQTHRQIDLRHFQMTDELKYARHELTERYTDDDAQEDPQTEIALKHIHRSIPSGLLRYANGLADRRTRIATAAVFGQIR